MTFGNHYRRWRHTTKVADFGIYREMDAASNNAQTFIGTLSYMSPERIAGADYGCPADIWAVGLTIISVALGRCPVNDNGRGYWTLLQVPCHVDAQSLLFLLRKGTSKMLAFF